MLQVNIPTIERYDESTNEFIQSKAQTLQLEHSLVSISKWEAKWHKPFLGKEQKSIEETIDYIKCMTLTQNVDPDVYVNITNNVVNDITEYIDAPMTATTFSQDKKTGKNREVITAEIIYYWMIALNIPVKFEKWHLNRLLALIQVCNIKNSPPKKMSKREIMNRNRSLNEARKSAANTRG